MKRTKTKAVKKPGKTRAKVVFCRLHHTLVGECYHGGNGVIRIDLRKRAVPARTFLHEKLHLENPELSETKILALERRIWRRMTQYERFELNKELFNRMFLEEIPE